MDAVPSLNKMSFVLPPDVTLDIVTWLLEDPSGSCSIGSGAAAEARVDIPPLGTVVILRPCEVYVACSLVSDRLNRPGIDRNDKTMYTTINKG